MALLKLQGLVDASSSNAALKLTTDQVTAILPVLKAWKANLSQASESDTKGYTKTITAVLTDAQKAYRPQPPQGNDGTGNSGGQPPAGGPPDVGSLLDRLIQELS